MPSGGLSPCQKDKLKRVVHAVVLQTGGRRLGSHGRWDRAPAGGIDMSARGRVDVVPVQVSPSNQLCSEFPMQKFGDDGVALGTEVRAIFDEKVRLELALVIEKSRDQIDEFHIGFAGREIS